MREKCNQKKKNKKNHNLSLEYKRKLCSLNDIQIIKNLVNIYFSMESAWQNDTHIDTHEWLYRVIKNAYKLFETKSLNKF